MLLAVVVSYLVLAALVIAGKTASMAAFGLTMTSTPPARYLLVNMLIGMVAAGVGGYLAARLAPAGRAAMTAGVFLLVFLVVGVLSGRASASATEPLWYQAVVTLLGASGLLCGVVIERAQAAGRR
jgi:hypothetical protein